jgi:DNA-binding GntR family transcriptional regulator
VRDGQLPNERAPFGLSRFADVVPRRGSREVSVVAPLISKDIAQIDRPRPLSELVMDQIRDLIIAGQLKPGEQLSEVALAEQLGVSRTPIREALRSLEAERLVEIRPSRGTYVFHYALARLIDISQLREVLEMGALRIALKRDRDALICELSNVLELSSATLGHDILAYQAYDTMFHSTLVSFSHNSELIDTYSRISGRAQAIRRRFTNTFSQVERSHRDHCQIVSRLKSKDDKGAKAALSRHIHNVAVLYRVLKEGDGSETTSQKRSAHD